jgi:hypothetical protein
MARNEPFGIQQKVHRNFDSIFAMITGIFLERAMGIPMVTNCVPVLTDFF